MAQVVQKLNQQPRVKSVTTGPRRTDLNFVFMFLDDAGAEWFSWSGLLEPNGGHAYTPRLNEMRTRGVSFTRAYANPICSPSRGRLLSGQYAFDNGLAGNPIVSDDFNFCGGGTTAANFESPPAVTLKLMPKLVRLGRDGTDDQTLGESAFTYALGWFGKDHLCSDVGRETYPMDHGFGRFIGEQGNSIDTYPGAHHYSFVEWTETFGVMPTSRTWGASGVWPAGGPYVAYSPDTNGAWDGYKVMRDAVQWIGEQSHPFIAYICMNPPHAPFQVPPYTCPDDVGFGATGRTRKILSTATQVQMAALDGGGKGPGYEPTTTASIVQSFRGGIEGVDSMVGLLWDRMDPRKREKTVFVFIGDNGTTAEAVESPYSAGHAKRSTYEQGTRVPLIIWGPQNVIERSADVNVPRTTDALFHVVDIMPTVLDMAQCDPALWNPGGTRKVRGVSFAPLLADSDASDPRGYIYNEIFLPLNGTISGVPAAILPNRWSKTYSDGTWKLYQKVAGSVPLYELYNITDALQPGSGQQGYLELSADNRYASVGIDPTITGIYNTLLAAMTALLAS